MAASGHSECWDSPGNPVSALISAHVFLKPMLRRMLGLNERTRPLPEAILGVALEANGPRQHYLRGVSEWGDDGARIVRPVPSQRFLSCRRTRPR